MEWLDLAVEQRPNFLLDMLLLQSCQMQLILLQLLRLILFFFFLIITSATRQKILYYNNIFMNFYIVLFINLLIQLSFIAYNEEISNKQSIFCCSHPCDRNICNITNTLQCSYG